MPAGTYWKSSRVKKGEVERPWLDKKDPRDKWNTIFPVAGLVLGLIVVGILIWDAIRSTPMHKYCEVLNENFTSWNSSVWTYEVEVGGYGNGQFEMTTNTDENVFIKDGVLIIKPTLQDEKFIENNHTIDLRGQGCTGSKWTDCVTTTNTTNSTIINPVKSGRINTKLGASIKYGRIEVVAKLPKGDWMWPAIWMLPKDSVYGDWPRSGEIDIMESRGNNKSYAQGGNNVASSTLHFGPDPDNNGWWRNQRKRQAFHTTYAEGFNTFGIEWSEKYIFTYINSRLQQVLFNRFKRPFWDIGEFPLASSNGTRLINPWKDTGSNASPFDQDFYLVLDVAVGGTNGWFEDGKSGKPWIDRSSLARKDFWDTRDEWYKTWRQGGQMEVRSVRMWQQEGYNGCDMNTED
ncbi:hypothetical protein N0V83_006036 [Neocucurbitaria cava]|uniref:GH16 domain-containing protein n=1 Tax=Neocucurbitaria cava TaxID=798079 RepID=A0A9W9CKV1_9PLEO|nr:hypothetical protein N0V83_006036 [Neocucurbitaria cava]